MGRLRDHYGDGAFYDAEYVHIRGDIPYYERVAEDAEGPILELACGTGRLSIPMAGRGVHVTGIDASPSMIAQAERKRADLPVLVQNRLRFVEGDLRTARLGQKFRAVVLGFNTLMHMVSDDDLQAALATVWDHLSDQGLFHFDLHTPFPELLARDPDARYDPQEMIDPHSGDRYVVTESNRYDPRSQVNHMSFYYQRVDRNGRPTGQELKSELALRVIFPRELDRWLHSSGFDVVGDWDDFERQTPFSGRGGRRVVVAKKRGAAKQD